MSLRRFAVFPAFFLTLLLSGCVLSPRSASSVRLEDILLPVKDSLVATDKKPLTFPATVAILMVPQGNRVMVPDTTMRIAAEALKKELVKNTRYVSGVTIVSQSDLRSKVTLQTLHDLYGADVVVLVTHQQDRRMIQSGFAQFTNITIVTAYLVPTVKVTTTSAVDAKIIHIPSNAVIFRSSGFNERVSWMTPAVAEQSNADEESIKGFLSAIDDLGHNITGKLNQMDQFDARTAVPLDQLLAEDAKAGPPTATAGPGTPDEWNRVDTYKRSGGGALDGVSIGALGLLGLWRRRRRAC